MTKKQQKAFKEWLKDKPKVIQKLAAKFPPDKLYRIKKTSQIGQLISYSEDNTMMIQVELHADKRRLVIPYNVFGLRLKDIELYEQ